MSLSAEQLRARDGKLTASRVGVLMSGDPEKVLRLWEEMTGQREPEDLSDVWPVQLGIVTESLNLTWYARKVAPVTRIGEVVICPRASWAAATLDGFDELIPAPIECKHCGGFEKIEVISARYAPQLTWQMLCSETKHSVLSVIQGAQEPALVPFDLDATYATELWTRAERFIECVNDLVEPIELAPVAAPIMPTKCYDMQGSNAWSSAAFDWLANKDAAKAFERATKDIKALVPADAIEAIGHRIQAKRDKRGLTISAMKG